jgi:hypothetical protein
MGSKMVRKPKAGRPPRHAGERLVKNRTFRVWGSLDDQLQATAEQSRRTVSAEIEFRLEHSYQVDWVDAQMKALFGMGIKDGLLIPGLGELGSVEPIKRWATRFAKRLADIEAEERRLKKSERRHEMPRAPAPRHLRAGRNAEN